MSQRRVSIITGIFPPDIGGPATSVPTLAAAIRERGDLVTVVTLADDPDSRPDDACPVVRIPRSQPFRYRIPAVVRATLRSRPDIVFANGLHFESALLPRLPVVQKIVGDWAWERATTNHLVDVSLEEFQTTKLHLRPALLRHLRSYVTRRAQRVVVPSCHLARIVAAWGITRSRIHVIPNAAPPARPLPIDRPPRILYVGRLVPLKNIDHVVRVLPRLPDVDFTIIGEGPTAGDLLRLTEELGIGDRVNFTGPLSREAVFRHMRENAGVLVLSSSHEGMPHVVLEAFAAGLPVVASDAGGTPELVRDGVSGLLYPTGDLEKLTGALHDALMPHVAARLAAGGAEVAARHSLEALVTATMDVMDRTLSRTGSAGTEED